MAPTVLLANHSSYPSRSGVADAVASVREQLEAGLDLPTPGQSAWTEPLAELLRHIDGLSLRAPQPVPGTGLFLPAVVVDARLRRRAPAVPIPPAPPGAPPLKYVLPGPYTLARLSAVSTTAYRGLAPLAAEYAQLIAERVAELAAAGAAAVQIDEPLCAAHPEDVRLVREILDPVQDAASERLPLVLSVYGTDAEPSYALLSSLPGDVLAVDLCASSRLARTIGETGCCKRLALGIVSGATESVEVLDDLAGQVATALHRYVHDTVYLQPASGLGTLAPPAARAKLQILGRVRERLLAPA